MWARALVLLCVSRVRASAARSVATSCGSLSDRTMEQPGKVWPTIFLSHGGGPCFFLPDEGIFKGQGKGSDVEQFYRHGFTDALAKAGFPEKPRAILILSAHWEEKVPTLTTNPKPTLLFDYYGFPKETYDLRYDSPHSVEVEKRVLSLLSDAGIKHNVDSKRGLDHGVFVPMLLVYPDAGVPVLQLSLYNNLDPAAHFALGEALAPLRAEGVLIIGSGSTTHPRGLFDYQDRGMRFIDRLEKSLLSSENTLEERKKDVFNFISFPNAREMHPRTEHFVPLFAAWGAATGKATRIYSAFTNILAYHSYMFQ
jgi:aromatic ring-opening dioxygenase catalytic subunit (LigB family)